MSSKSSGSIMKLGLQYRMPPVMDLCLHPYGSNPFAGAASAEALKALQQAGLSRKGPCLSVLFGHFAGDLLPILSCPSWQTSADSPFDIGMLIDRT